MRIFAVGDCCDADEPFAFRAQKQGEVVASNIEVSKERKNME